MCYFHKMMQLKWGQICFLLLFTFSPQCFWWHQALLSLFSYPHFYCLWNLKTLVTFPAQCCATSWKFSECSILVVFCLFVCLFVCFKDKKLHECSFDSWNNPDVLFVCLLVLKGHNEIMQSITWTACKINQTNCCCLWTIYFFYLFIYFGGICFYKNLDVMKKVWSV